MILKDLIILDKYLFVEMGGFVIIKRDETYYEIAVRMRHDYEDPNHLVQNAQAYKDLTTRFMEECRKVNEHWKIGNRDLEDVRGIKIHEEEFVF